MWGLVAWRHVTVISARERLSRDGRAPRSPNSFVVARELLGQLLPACWSRFIKWAQRASSLLLSCRGCWVYPAGWSW